MGKLVLITVLGAITMVGILNFSTNQNMIFSLEKSVDYYAETTARNIANSTIEILKTKLNTDNTLRVETPTTIDLFRGTATYTINDVLVGSDSLVKISVTASYYGIERSVSALASLNGRQLPPVLNYVTIGEMDVIFNGIPIYVKDANNPNLNASVHSNDLLKFNGSIATEGFATSAALIVSSTGVFTPNDNPDGLPTSYITSPISIPVINVDDYIGIADEIYYSDKTYTGNITLGTKANPKIIYIQGKLFIDGTITGYGTFLVKDEIKVMGNLTINSPDPNEGNLLLMTNTKVIISLIGTQVHANIVAQGEVKVNGNNITVIGSLLSSTDKVYVNNNGIKILFKPISTNIADDFFTLTPSTGKLTVLHWYE